MQRDVQGLNEAPKICSSCHVPDLAAAVLASCRVPVQDRSVQLIRILMFEALLPVFASK